ncbi:hypothetical protein ABBQ32_012995 [Trebouxia sp. C0010 RCD-2024]
MPERYELDYYKWLHVPDDAEWALIKDKLQPYQDLAGPASQPFFDSLEVLFTRAECRQQYDKHLRYQRARRDALPLAVLMVSAYKDFAANPGLSNWSSRVWALLGPSAALAYMRQPWAAFSTFAAYFLWQSSHKFNEAIAELPLEERLIAEDGAAAKILCNFGYVFLLVSAPFHLPQVLLASCQIALTNAVSYVT